MSPSRGYSLLSVPPSLSEVAASPRRRTRWFHGVQAKPAERAHYSTNHAAAERIRTDGRERTWIRTDGQNHGTRKRKRSSAASGPLAKRKARWTSVSSEALARGTYTAATFTASLSSCSELGNAICVKRCASLALSARTSLVEAKLFAVSTVRSRRWSVKSPRLRSFRTRSTCTPNATEENRRRKFNWSWRKRKPIGALSWRRVPRDTHRARIPTRKGSTPPFLMLVFGSRQSSWARRGAEPKALAHRRAGTIRSPHRICWGSEWGSSAWPGYTRSEAQLRAGAHARSHRRRHVPRRGEAGRGKRDRAQPHGQR